MALSQPTCFGTYPWAVGSGISPVLFGGGLIPQSYSLSLTDSVAEIDAQLFSSTKTLNDFLILKEWLSVHHIKALVWSNPVVNANLHDFLFGKYTFGSQLFGGVKPSSSWTKGSRGPNVWTNTDGSKYNY